MFPSSLYVILAGLLMGGVAVGAFVWAWRRGQFDHLDALAGVILDERDRRMERPWETPLQAAERAASHGPLLEPSPGEWGGAR